MPSRALRYDPATLKDVDDPVLFFRVLNFLDTEGEVTSPYFDGDSGNVRGWHDVGEYRPKYIMPGHEYNSAQSMLHEGKLIPTYKDNHYGWSILIKPDPELSIFPPWLHYLDQSNYYGMGSPIIGATKQLFKHQINQLKRNNPSVDLNKLSGFTIPKDYKIVFSSNFAWDALVNHFKAYTDKDYDRKLPSNALTPPGDRLILAAASKNDIIDNATIMDNNMDANRDSGGEGLSRRYLFLSAIPNAHALADEYFRLRKQYPKTSAMDIFYSVFHVDPVNVISDKQLKNIYNGMCNAYNNSYGRQNNITNSIKELGQ